MKALGWPEIEDAVGRQDWAAASKLAREFEREWRTIRGFVAVFGALGAWSHAIDTAMVELLAALDARPVDLAAVEQAMEWFRRFAP